MDRVKIIIEDGTEREVSCIFYLYKSKYYFIYTEGQIDENGYVILYLVQVGKEIKNTPTGNIDTGYMVGVEISNPEEWASVQKSISMIVEDKKSNKQNSEIQYLPLSMLATLKILSKKTFRLLKQIIEDNFKLNLSGLNNNLESSTVNQSDTLQQTTLTGQQSSEIQNTQTINNDISSATDTTVPLEPQVSQNISSNLQTDTTNSQVGEFEGNQTYANIDNVNSSELNNNQNSDIIIDYRSRFFEEQDKNSELQAQVDELKQKLENIKNIIG